MRKLAIVLLSVLLFNACKTESSKQEEEKELSAQERIAQAHGFNNWDKVESIAFTWNIDRDSTHFDRSWIWKPKTGEVTSITKSDTITYNHKNVDSTLMRTDQGFINDKFWLLVPFQLMWDTSATISSPVSEKAPITGKELKKIVLTYPDSGGYTPGDAYDIYFNDDYLIEEWVFRKGNAAEPSLSCTFENYKEINGFRFATEHKRPNDSWNLNFTDIQVDLSE